ncbi:MAG TPA: hypothetical protein DD735_07515 [Clostridiales bacterium]|nr:hypothetical protein [Clostridiales bacterium]
MVIRRAEDADIGALMGMYRRLYAHLKACGLCYEPDFEQIENALSAQIRARLFCVLVAEGGGGLAGFISAAVSRVERRFKGGLVGVINDLYIEPSARGTGAASALADAAETWMRESGAESARCDIVAGNAGGFAFWHGRGYADASVAARKSLAE